MAREHLNRREEFIARVTRPGQSEGMTAFLESISKLDDQTFERMLEALAQMPEVA